MYGLEIHPYIVDMNLGIELEAKERRSIVVISHGGVGAVEKKQLGWRRELYLSHPLCQVQ